MITGMAGDDAAHVKWFDDELIASRATVLRAIDQLDELRAELAAEAARSIERRAELRALVDQSTRRADDRRLDPSPVYLGPGRRSTDDPTPDADAGPPVRDRRRRPLPIATEPIGINQQRFRD